MEAQGCDQRAKGLSLMRREDRDDAEGQSTPMGGRPKGETRTVQGEHGRRVAPVNSDEARDESSRGTEDMLGARKIRGDGGMQRGPLKT